MFFTHDILLFFIIISKTIFHLENNNFQTDLTCSPPAPPPTVLEDQSGRRFIYLFISRSRRRRRRRRIGGTFAHDRRAGYRGIITLLIIGNPGARLFIVGAHDAPECNTGHRLMPTTTLGFLSSSCYFFSFYYYLIHDALAGAIV